MKKTITILAAAAAVVALAACGTDKAQEAVANAPQPTVTVTAPAPPAPPAPTVTVTAKADSSVPQACLDALDNADEGFGYAAGAMGAAGEGFDAVSVGDIDKLLEQIPVMKSMGTKLNNLAPTYNTNKAACRAAGN
jgi:curli biogenesis system outer membrane secretion channel CsgG